MLAEGVSPKRAFWNRSHRTLKEGGSHKIMYDPPFRYDPFLSLKNICFYII
jgi:hypothetical protein